MAGMNFHVGQKLIWIPYCQSWTQAEITRARSRMERLEQAGLVGHEADLLVDALVERDRGYEDRRICLECKHLKSKGGELVCGNWQAALPFVLQRCDGFDLRGGK